jgi:hypothetical protein
MNTIAELFENSVKRFGNNPYLLEKKTDKYVATTFKRQESLLINSPQLIQMGIKRVSG